MFRSVRWLVHIEGGHLKCLDQLYGMVWYGMVWYGMVLYGIVSGKVWYDY